MPLARVLFACANTALAADAESTRLRGHSVTTAGSGLEAVRLALLTEPDVVVTDAVLADLDAQGLANRLSVVNVTSPILVSDGGVVRLDRGAEGPSFDRTDERRSPVPELAENAAGKEEWRRPPCAMDRRVRAVVRWLIAEIANPLPLQQLAASVNLSSSRLEHLFRADVGVSITRFRQEQRVGEAARLLASTFEHVSQIAYATGFQSLSHFDRAFRQYQHVSPTRYRDTHRKIALHAVPRVVR